MRKIENDELGRLSAAEFGLKEKTPIVVVLDNVRSAMNVGSFFRTADAFALQEVVLCGFTATPPSKEIHKTALGAELTVEWSQAESTVDAVVRLKSEGWIIVAVEQVEGAVMLNNFEVLEGAKYALVFGNEVDGVAQEVVDLVDCAVEIPQVGTKHSLNVGVAGGVVLWHFFNRK